MMDDLEVKLFGEMENESIVIACRFPFPNKKPVAVIGGGIGWTTI